LKAFTEKNNCWIDDSVKIESHKKIREYYTMINESISNFFEVIDIFAYFFQNIQFQNDYREFRVFIIEPLLEKYSDFIKILCYTLWRKFKGWTEINCICQPQLFRLSEIMTEFWKYAYFRCLQTKFVQKYKCSFTYWR